MSRQFGFYHLPPEEVKTFATEAAVCGCIAKVTFLLIYSTSQKFGHTFKGMGGCVQSLGWFCK